MSAVRLWHGTLPPVNEQEALRYAGAREATTEITALLKECVVLCENQLAPRVCYAFYPISRDGEWLDLGFARTQSAALRRNLGGCNEIVLFGATIGLNMDRLIARYGKVSPARAAMLQAIGAERIESLCDAFEAHMICLGHELQPRFSPGYGDLPIDIQRDIFAALDCPKNIGISLNESLLMSPSKSVTAMIGIGTAGGERCVHNCAACMLRECLYRR